jgi:N4-gp56 family major capsid protein
MASGITGTGSLAASPTAYSGTSSQLTQAIQTIWSKEILFQSMPILRFEQFAVKKTELGVAPGLQINFMRYNNLGAASALVEGVRMQTNALTAQQFSITVAEHGYAIAVSELLLNASFDDVMASASRLLGRNMAIYLDGQARDTLMAASSVIYGYSAPEVSTAKYGAYNNGTVATSRASMTGDFFLSPAVIKDAVETLATKNIPRLGETYVAFVHPHQSRKLRDNPEFIEVSKYAAPGNFMLGEIGRLYDCVFIETTQVEKVPNGAGSGYTTDSAVAPVYSTGGGYTSPVTKQGNGNKDRFSAIFIGDNAFGHAISLPVELRDGGILDFGREHALAWYAIYGLGLITDQSVVIAETN